MKSMPSEIIEKNCYVDPDIRKAETLPAPAFSDPEFLSLEVKTLFSKTWILVPEHDVPEKGPASMSEFLRLSGSRVPFSLLGKSLFLQRRRDGVLNCFPNVCTHAWHTLVEEANVGGRIICPQHGREFDDEGRFFSQVGFETLEDFPREADHLRNLQVGELGQFFLVCLDEPSVPFACIVDDLKSSILGIDMAGLRRRRVEGEVREVEGNWKQHAWNYMDNYHIRFVHKGPGGLADAIDLSSYKTELYQYSSLQWAYARNPKDGFAPGLLAPRFQDSKNPGRRVFALWWFIFPNLTLNFYPWGLSVNVYMPIPGKPDRTLFLWYNYSLDEEKFRRRNKEWLNEQVDAEDIEAISKVTKGAQSGYAPRGRFVPGEEAGPHWFHRLVYDTVFQSGK